MLRKAFIYVEYERTTLRKNSKRIWKKKFWVKNRVICGRKREKSWIFEKSNLKM